MGKQNASFSSFSASGRQPCCPKQRCMKFAKQLQTEAVPEWRRKYIQYKQLKKLLKQIPATPPPNTAAAADGTPASRAGTAGTNSAHQRPLFLLDQSSSPPSVAAANSEAPLTPIEPSPPPESPLTAVDATIIDISSDDAPDRALTPPKP